MADGDTTAGAMSVPCSIVRYRIARPQNAQDYRYYGSLRLKVTITVLWKWGELETLPFIFNSL